MKVLIAEDEPAFRHLLEEILPRWGYEVVLARDGKEAWQALRAKDAPRLAVLDWLMPEMDGVEICRGLRKEPQKPYTYIILLTAQGREESLVTGMEAGADDYLVKPLKTSELRVRLNAGRRIVELQNELIAAREALTAHAGDLEAANRDLEAFSYAVSSDLLKSLLAIGSHAHAIKELAYCKNDEQCSAYTKRIYDKIRHLGEIVGLMHDFFRPARIELHREAVDLSEMAGKTAENLRVKQPERRAMFRIAAGVMASADRQLLQVALDNLFTNAWQHTGKREEAVIEFGVTDFEGEPAFFVRDNGTGFDMAHADRIFAPFQHLPGTEEFAGPGVGLATVERIVRRHGGRVWAEGEPGKGATFYFTLG